MIAFLRGKILETTGESVVIEAQGVGYEAFCVGRTASELRDRIGQEAGLWIYTHVREDALQLFGFDSRPEKDFFISLLKVNGIGPKSALAILNGGSFEKLLSWIEAGDAKALAGLPKVGKKTAEQIVLTLQGKLVRVEPSKIKKSATFEKIHFALVNLGFKPQVVEDFVIKLPPDIEVEEGVRRGLTSLSKVF